MEAGVLLAGLLGALGTLVASGVGWQTWRNAKARVAEGQRRDRAGAERRRELDSEELGHDKFNDLVEHQQSQVESLSARVGTLEDQLRLALSSMPDLRVENALLHRDVADRDATIDD